MYILAIAYRGVVHHVKACPTRIDAEGALLDYLRDHRGCTGPGDRKDLKEWIEAHCDDTSVEIVEQPDLLPRPPRIHIEEVASNDDEELTPADRAAFVKRIEEIPPYNDGLDAHGAMVRPDEFVTDLLTDLRHYCDHHALEYAACDRTAYDPSRKECAAEKEGAHG